MVSVDIKASEEARKNYNEIGFPPIFKRYAPKMEDLSPNMRQFFESYRQKIKPQVTTGFTAENMLLGTVKG